MGLEEIIVLSRKFLDIKNAPYRRYFINTVKLNQRFSVILGQRGVGKTTSLIQYLLDYVDGDKTSHKILYVQADHFLMLNMTLYEIAERFEMQGGEFIAFDEIHKYADWSRELKSIYDTFPNLKILASGSSALEVYKGTYDLSRRAAVYFMHGMSLREYMDLHNSISLPILALEEILANHEKLAGDIIDTIEKANCKVLPEFHKYLQYGYYPYFLEVKDVNVYYMTLEQNLHVTIDSDLSSIHPSLTGNSIKKIEQLLKFIADSVPFTPNWQNLKNTLEVGDVRTLKLYFKYLEDAGLIRGVMRATDKLRKIELPEKVYLNDANQYYALSPSLQNIGAVRETFFLSMLSHAHMVAIPADGDFVIDKKYVFEIGGRNKTLAQIKNVTSACAYLACDDIEEGVQKRIPLWMFGLIY